MNKGVNENQFFILGAQLGDGVRMIFDLCGVNEAVIGGIVFAWMDID